MCKREGVPLTEHHLIPRAVHGKKSFARRFSKLEMKSRKLICCKLCHNGIHDLIPDEKDLARNYNTLELLLEDDKIKKHVEWVKKQKG